MGKKLRSHEVAKWFIYNNPSLASGYFDENAKLNKLLYFASLIYYCAKEEELLDEAFVAFPNGPVIKSVYRDYRYNGLDKMPANDNVIGMDTIQKQVLNITNFVYGDKDTDFLIKETHEHSLWKNLEKKIPNNPVINFSEVEQTVSEQCKSLFLAYQGFDFSVIRKDKINGNIFYYNALNFIMTDEILEALSNLSLLNEPQYIEMIDGELVFS